MVYSTRHQRPFFVEGFITTDDREEARAYAMGKFARPRKAEPPAGPPETPQADGDATARQALFDYPTA